MEKRISNKPNYQNLKHFFCISLICFSLSSCLSTKDITYFNYYQKINPEQDELVTNMVVAYTPVIKAGDILSITVSSMDKEDREIFNPFPPTTTYQSQTGGFINLQPIQGFKVDTLGNISFPRLGDLKVVGLTAKDLETKMTKQLEQYIKSPTVYVHIANYIISVLGEVARPAQYVIPHNQITLPEVLALAGDLSIYGNRKNVLIVRELDGQRIFGRVDLTNRNLFRSSYYYLHPGDVVYVEPTKGRLTSTDRTYQLTPIIISSLSFLLLIVNTLIK